MTDDYDIHDDLDADQAPDEAPTYAPDPIGRTLAVFAFLLIVAVLSVTVGMVLYLQDDMDLPRSALERDIAVYETAVRESPGDQQNHISLALAYARAGRMDLARDSIDLARQVDENAAVDLAEAEVLRLDGEHEEALALYMSAEVATTRDHERAQQEMAEAGIEFPIDRTVLIQATQGQALVLWELDRREEALAAVRRATEIAPQDASLQVLLGRYLLEAGDAEGAREAYILALSYVPDYPPAIEGLREVEEALDD